MSGLPLIPLKELVAAVSTWTPERDDPDGNFTYVDLSAVNQDTKLIEKARELACVRAPSRARQLVRTDDILVSTVRPNLNAVARVPVELDGATASTGFCVLRPISGKLDSSYLLHWVRSPRFVAEMTRRATGASYPAVSERIIIESAVPLPPLPNQRRIAEILDRSDGLRAKRRAAVAQIDNLTRTIFYDMFGDPATNTKLWPREALGVLLDIEWGNTSITKESYIQEGVPAYSASGRDGFLPEAEHEGEGIVLSAIGARCGKCFYVPGGRWTAIKNTITMRPKAASGIELQYVMPLVNNERFWPNRGAGQPFIALGTARSQKIPVPPLALQKEFSNRVAQIQSVRQDVTKSLAMLDTLFASIRDRAFQGTL